MSKNDQENVFVYGSFKDEQPCFDSNDMKMMYPKRFKIKEPSGLLSFKDSSFYLSIESKTEVDIIIKALSSDIDHEAA